MAKRKTLQDRRKGTPVVGQGVSILTQGLGEADSSPTMAAQAEKADWKQVYMKLPPDLIKRRNKIWAARVAVDDTAEKTQILLEAVEWYIDKLEREGDPFLEGQ